MGGCREGFYGYSHRLWLSRQYPEIVFCGLIFFVFVGLWVYLEQYSMIFLLTHSKWWYESKIMSMDTGHQQGTDWAAKTYLGIDLSTVLIGKDRGSLFVNVRKGEWGRLVIFPNAGWGRFCNAEGRSLWAFFVKAISLASRLCTGWTSHINPVFIL